MLITEGDFKDVDTHGLEYEIHPQAIEAVVDLPNCKIYVSKRPFYCDRGRWMFHVENKPNQHKVSIDWADCFPRYFFKLQIMLFRFCENSSRIK